MLSTLFPLLVALQLGASATPEPERLNLSTVLSRAANHTSVLAAQSTAEQARARATEVARMWIPRIEINALGGPSPIIRCSPSPAQCISTVPNQLELGFSGFFWRLDASLDMPLFTFGKLTAGKKASRAGARASEALAIQTEHGVAVDAAKAYFAVKLGRELVAMLQEGRAKVQEEGENQEKALEEGSGDVTEADHRRLLTLLAEIDARLAEAHKVEELGLAGIHYAMGDTTVDVDTQPLMPLAFKLPPVTEAMAQASARPEQMAADAGAEAAQSLAELERARWYPDVVLAGRGTLARASAVEHPDNAFLNDPFNVNSGGLGVVLRWTPDVGLRAAKIAQAEADWSRARATAEMARTGLPADVERVWADLHDASDRLKASKQGERHAKAWLASILQAQAAGLMEPRDLADALLQYFMMRARTIQGTFDWNVGVMALQRAVGKFPDVVTFEED